MYSNTMTQFPDFNPAKYEYFNSYKYFYLTSFQKFSDNDCRYLMKAWKWNFLFTHLHPKVYHRLNK